MLPPHQPARRKKSGAVKAVRSATKQSTTKARAKRKTEPSKAALKVLARAVVPSPVAAQRTRRIGC